MDVLNQSLRSARDRLERGIVKIDRIQAELKAQNAPRRDPGPFSADGPWMKQLVQQREVLVKTAAFISSLIASAPKAKKRR